MAEGRTFFLCPTVLCSPHFVLFGNFRGGEHGIWRALNNSDSWLFVSLVLSLPAVTNFDCAHVVTSRPSDGNGSEDSMQEISREPHTQKRSTQKRRTEELGTKSKQAEQQQQHGSRTLRPNHNINPTTPTPPFIQTMFRSLLC